MSMITELYKEVKNFMEKYISTCVWYVWQGCKPTVQSSLISLSYCSQFSCKVTTSGSGLCHCSTLMGSEGLLGWLRRRIRRKSRSDQFPQEQHCSLKHGVNVGLQVGPPGLITDSWEAAFNVRLSVGHTASPGPGSGSGGQGQGQGQGQETKKGIFLFLGRKLTQGRSSLTEEAEGDRAGERGAVLETLQERELSSQSHDSHNWEDSRCDDSVFSDCTNSLIRSDTHEVVNMTLGDFRIKYSELEFSGRINTSPDSSSSSSMIHHGRWHGDVVIHSHQPQDDEEVSAWLAEVRSLAHIRHENFVLYMGACCEPPRFAIVTSPVKADSLYTHLVTKGLGLSDYSKFSVLRQTVNAFCYLHAKNISHGRLSSQNIFLESKVKVSLLDYAANLPNLQYLAPEIASQIVAGKKLNTVKTKEGDIFSFGTLMYQLATGRLPLDSLSLPSLQSAVISGHQAELLQSSSSPLDSNLCGLIRKCWLREPEERLTFLRLNRLLQPGNCISKKQSSSEPRNLDQITKTSGLFM